LKVRVFLRGSRQHVRLQRHARHGSDALDGVRFIFEDFRERIPARSSASSLNAWMTIETKLAIEKAAADGMRSVSSLVEKILTQWPRKKGYLKK